MTIIYARDVKLLVAAELENVYCMEPAVGGDFRWYLKLKCTQCNETMKDFIYIDPAVQEQSI